MKASTRGCAGALLVLLFAIHAAVFGWRSITFDRRVTADSMNYIDVARNLSAGEGLVQSTAGFNQPTFWERDFSTDFPPKTRAGHNPGYSVLIAAAAEVTGLEHADAAFLVGIVSYAAATTFVFLFTARLLGAGAGLLAAAFFAHQLRWIFLRVWTEPVVLALLFATLAVLARGATPHRAIAAGLLAGAALLVRGGMLPMLGLGGLACLLGARHRSRLLLFVTGASVALIGPFLGEGHVYPPQTTIAASWFPHVAVGELVATFLERTFWDLAALAAFGACAWWRARRDGAPLVPDRARTGCLLAAAWIAGWSVFLIAARLVVLSDMFDDRMLAPARAVLAVGCAILLWRACAERRRQAVAVALFSATMLFGIAGDAVVLGDSALTQRVYASAARVLVGRNVTARSLPPNGDRSDLARWILTSPSRLWVGRNVTPRDLVVGAGTTDLPYFFRSQVPAAVSFSPYPYFARVSGTRFKALFLSRCGRYDNMYLILLKLPRAWGGFARGLLARAPAAPGTPAANFALVADVADAMVYRFTACDR